MNWLWYVVQAAIVFAVVAFNIEINPEPAPPAAALIVGAALAFALTFSVTKGVDAVRFVRRLLRSGVGYLRHRSLERSRQRISPN